MVLTDNLIAYYKLDETSGSTATDTIGSYDGTITGSPTQGATGKIGTAYTFDGTAGVYIDASTGAFGTKGSLQAWIRVPTSPTGNDTFIGTTTIGANSAHQLKVTSAKKVYVIIGDGTGNWATITGGTTLADNTYYHVVVTWETGSTVKMYLNGTLDGTSAVLASIGTSTDIRIGNAHNNSEAFVGEIDEVGLWTRVISTGEISELYNSGNGFAYPFNPKTLTTSVDPVGYGTVSGGGVYTKDQVVAVEASPTIGKKFSSWSGDLTGSVNPTTITMSADKSITANFVDYNVSFTAGQIAESLPIDYANGTVTKATMTVTKTSGTFTYQMTADGTNWETVTTGAEHTFVNTGTDLRWRVTESGASTGAITKVEIDITH